MYKPPSILWLRMLSSHFCCRDISLYQQDDMLKTLSSVNFFTISTSRQSVAFPKSIMKLKIDGISDSLLKAHSFIMFHVGSILYFVYFCYLHFRFDFSILHLKIMIEGKKRWIVLLNENNNASENLSSSWNYFVWLKEDTCQVIR